MKENTIICGDWYSQLLTDLKRLAFEGIVKTKHAIGKRILEDELKFGKPEYGSKRIENLAKDMDVDRSDLTRCIQFARKFPEYVTSGHKFSWRYIRRNLLPEQREKPETPPLPEGKFDVIYADPPWQYDNAGLGGAAEKHYQTMPLQDICDLEIPSAENSVLFLWTTNPFLEDSFAVINSWGFDYKTNFCWIKEGRATYGKLGFYVRGRHELLLIATKGSMLPQGELPESTIKAKKSKHSKKPDKIYEIIEKMYHKGKYLELFARKKHSEKWTVWGLEV